MEEIKVRLGTPADEAEVLDIAMKTWEENGIKDVSVDKMIGIIRPALYLWEGLVGIIGEPGKKIEGGVLLRLTQMWYNDTWILEEKTIFVNPEFRSAKGGRARRLCEFSKHVADELDIPLMIGVLSNQRTEAKVKLYERAFGKPAGAFFLYNAKTGHSDQNTENE